MIYIVCEARRLIKREVNFKDNSWTEYSLKVELENGQDMYLLLTKNLVNDENIKALDELKGKDITVVCSFSHKGQYLNWYLNEIPQIEA
ncbi:hypothetical protein HYO11_18730 [Vibrio parahaemolyticus]|nr:hypothetical protein [Vibrio parahaemolyticus]